MPVGMITIRELLTDPQFKKYFTTVPELPDHYTEESQPWRLLVMKEGEKTWRAKRFGTYQEAFAGFKLMLPKIHDAAINCPALNFMPPVRTVRIKGKVITEGRHKGKPLVRTLVWKPRLEPDMLPHSWCGYCRRPTIFGNKALSPRMLNGTRLPATYVKLRCLTCGASADLMNIRYPERNQRWDINRPTVM